MRPCLALLLTLALAVALPARADWPTGGKAVLIVDNSFNDSREHLFFDLPGGGLALVAVGQGQLANGFTAQRLTSTGDFAPGWDLLGHSFSQLTMANPFQAGFAVDDSSCIWRVGYVGSPVGAYRGHLFAPDGSLRPDTQGWSMQRGGIPSGARWSSVAPGVNGDIYSTFSNKLLRVNRAGALMPGWPATGVALTGTDGKLLPDGAGGVVYFSSVVNPVAQRIDATGSRHAGWPASGLALSSAADAWIPAIWSSLVNSGPDGFIAGWITLDPVTLAPNGGVRIQRFRLDGTLDPAWPVDGWLVVPAGANTGPTMVADGSGGVYLMWYASGIPYATHVLVDGATLGNSATPLLPPDARFQKPRYGFPSQELPYVIGGVRSDGGLTFAWNDTTAAGARVIRVRRLEPDLTPDPDQPAAGIEITPEPQSGLRSVRTLRGLHSDGAGGAYIAWEVYVGSEPTGLPVSETWMTRVTPAPTTGAPPRPGVTTLALSAPRPNPARGSVVLDVTLPDGVPARVELLDVAGRIVRRQTAQGVGTHAITFSELGSLEPGLYFARAVSHTATRSARLVVTR